MTMKILFVAADPKPERWTSLIQQRLPDAEIQVWQPDNPSCAADYAIVWHPPATLFDKEPQLKAVFNLGAGVDALVRIDAAGGFGSLNVSNAAAIALYASRVGG